MGNLDFIRNSWFHFKIPKPCSSVDVQTRYVCVVILLLICLLNMTRTSEVDICLLESTLRLSLRSFCARSTETHGHAVPCGVPDRVSTQHLDLSRAETKGRSMWLWWSIISFRCSKCVCDTCVVSLCAWVSPAPYSYSFYFSSGNISDFNRVTVRLWEIHMRNILYLLKFYSGFVYIYIHIYTYTHIDIYVFFSEHFSCYYTSVISFWAFDHV